VVPVGDAWEKEFSAGNGAALFMPDGSHPSAFGNEVIGRAFYEAFYGK
jgi:lysophospholipase L1-like esterase